MNIRNKSFSTLHVNFWGNPGVGKSGLAGELYGRLSKAGYLVELVKEFAKELQYRGDLVRKDERTGQDIETEQMIISTEQYRRQAEYENRVQVIVTDSPVLQGVVFAPSHYRPELTTILRQLTAGWRTMDVLLNRDIRSDYNSLGRVQSPEESIALRPEIESVVRAERPEYVTMHTDEALERVFDAVVDHIERKKTYTPTF